MLEKISGCLFGLALGDALGAPVEFQSLADIEAQFPTIDSLVLNGQPARVTDDTQMALAVGNALAESPHPYEPSTLTPVIIRHFIHWYENPDNDRAPGMTVLNSIENLRRGQPWEQATDIRSKGCGATMRVQAVGLLPVDANQRAGLAQFQAALTHGHSTALAAADLTAWIIADLLQNDDLGTLLERARDYAAHQQRDYHETWLGELYQRALVFPTAADFIQRGWTECLSMIDRVEDALGQKNPRIDPAEVIGEGWIAEEAVAVALYSVLLHRDDPLTAIRRAAFTRGDSDSTACLTGAFAGAYHGMSSLPETWCKHIEYRSQLTTLAQQLSKMWSV